MRPSRRFPSNPFAASGRPEAEQRPHAGERIVGGVSDVELFVDEVVADLQRRAVLFGDCGDRRAIEDGIALLTCCRRGGIDEVRLETLLSTLRAGRSPGGVSVLKPRDIGGELTRRWHEHLTGVAVTARN
jgi:hypothetical protein